MPVFISCCRVWVLKNTSCFIDFSSGSSLFCLLWYLIKKRRQRKVLFIGESEFLLQAMSYEWGEERKQSWHLCFWFEGQSEHPLRSSVNHITLNHTRWAPGCRLWIHQQSETTLSVTEAMRIGQKKSESFIGTARHPMPFLLRNRCYVMCCTLVVSSPFFLIQSGICASWHTTFMQIWR